MLVVGWMSGCGAVVDIVDSGSKGKGMNVEGSFGCDVVGK